MAHAVSSIVANYDLVVEEFDGCSVPVLQAKPVSGKTTAMRAVLSVFGQTKFSGGKYEKKTNDSIVTRLSHLHNACSRMKEKRKRTRSPCQFFLFQQNLQPNM